MLYLEARVEGKPVRWPLPRNGRCVVGRGEECDLVVDDGSISRRHLQLHVKRQSVRVEDLGSRNGLWKDGERVGSLNAEPDRWFVTGRVLMTIRKGVSIASSDSVIPAGRHPKVYRDPSTTEGLEPKVEKADGSRSAIPRLVECLSAESDPEAALPMLIGHVADYHGATSATLLEESGNGWILHSAWGDPAPPELDEVLLHADPLKPIHLIESKVGAVLRCNVAALSGKQCVLMFHPWNESADAGEEIEFLIAICSWWLRLARAAPEQLRARETPEKEPSTDSSPFIAVAPASRQLLHEVDRLAPTDLSVILQGETGTGKELLALRLHRESPRVAGPFLAINCAALPKDLLEAELFGIERGVATGVNARSGKFLLASSGTLFLDEIGDLPLELQPKILRALENGEVTPLGAPAGLPIDVRIVAATHRDLRRMADMGEFREDLLYRLEGACVIVPPLRDRREDILPMARRFAGVAAAAQGRWFHGIDVEAARCLIGYAWPGNARELRNVMWRAVALGDGPILQADGLPQALLDSTDRRVGDAQLGLKDDWRDAQRGFARMYFSQLLERHGDNLSEAARVAGLSRSNLYRRLEELELRRKESDT